MLNYQSMWVCSGCVSMWVCFCCQSFLAKPNLSSFLLVKRNFFSCLLLTRLPPLLILFFDAWYLFYSIILYYILYIYVYYKYIYIYIYTLYIHIYLHIHIIYTLQLQIHSHRVSGWNHLTQGFGPIVAQRLLRAQSRPQGILAQFSYAAFRFDGETNKIPHGHGCFQTPITMICMIGHMNM